MATFSFPGRANARLFTWDLDTMAVYYDWPDDVTVHVTPDDRLDEVRIKAKQLGGREIEDARV